MGRFHSGEAASLFDGDLLIVWSEIIKLTAGEGLESDILVFSEDANTAADGHSCAFVVAWEDRKEDFIVSVETLLVVLQDEIQIWIEHHWNPYLPVSMSDSPRTLHTFYLSGNCPFFHVTKYMLNIIGRTMAERNTSD